MRVRRTVLVLATVAFAIAAPLGAGAAEAQTTLTVTEFSHGLSPTANLGSIVAGPDGNLWFTEGGGIGRITTSGVVTEFTNGISPGAYAGSIAVGSDGNVWFTETTAPVIGRITTTGVVTEFTTGITKAPYAITAGPDGNLWFTEINNDVIGRITTSGEVTEFPESLNGSLLDIVAGPDGNLWYTSSFDDGIGRMTPSGVATSFTTGISAGGQPSRLTVGPDGALWFTEDAGRIGRITTAGVISEFSANIAPNSEPLSIVTGPDGALWFTIYAQNRIGRITTAGEVTEYSDGISAGAGPQEITVGPDGNLWFTEAIGDRVAMGVIGSSASGGGGGGGGVPVSSPVSGTVGAGGSLSSDPAGTTPDASNPLVVGVTSPIGGAVSIDKTPPNTTVAHYSVLNVGATITAPAATTANPLKLSFQVFDGQLPQGSYASDLTVFRDGTPIGVCTKAGSATPDPCVASTSTVNGVTTINILSTHASTWDVEAAQVGRIGGADRIGTAVAVSKDSFPAGDAGAVVLARADDYPDALVGAPLAAAKNAPVLLTQGTQLPKPTSDEIKRVLPTGGTVFVLGGAAAVPDSVVNQLKSLGFVVVREGGADRYATAVAVADALGDPGTVLVATGTNFPDALAAGPAATHLHGVVLLTAGPVLPKATSGYLAAHAATTYAVGGPAAKADPAATVLVGADRFATAATVATTLFASPAMVGIATGQAFPDAVSGSALLARADAPLLLADTTSVPGATTGYLTAAGANLQTIHLFGGPAALADTVITQLQGLTS